MHLESARELLASAKKCAQKAGIAHKMFLGFGTMLGMVRDRGLIPYDDDMDICFLPCSPDEKETYHMECIKAGLMAGWPEPEKRVASKPNGELLWFSLKKEHKSTRSCVWFFVEWNNVLWHTKGKIWVSDLHFRKKLKWNAEDEGIMLGANKDYFKEFTSVTFEGGEYQVPKKAGSLLDEYYPNWAVPSEGGSSAQNLIARVGKWDDLKTWGIL